MKNLITAIASILILSVFIFQFAFNQVAHSRIAFAEEQINTFVEISKTEGCLTTSNKTKLKESLSQKLGCDPGEIIITGTETPVRRGQTITYSVTYPVKDIIGAARGLGISKEDNKATKRVEGSVTSEHVAWE